MISCKNALAGVAASIPVAARFIGDANVIPETLITWTYTAFGILACVAAVVALISRKGGDRHRLAGKIFFWAMMAAIASSVWTSLSTNEHFVLMLALLSGYLLISGYRVLYLKRPVPRDTVGHTRPGALDKGLAQFILIACSAMSAWGMMALPLNLSAMIERGMTSLLMIGVGLAGAMLALGDMRRFRRPPTDPGHWLITHGVRMLAGATIAFMGASVAFLPMVSETVRWSVPAGLGIFGIAVWVTLVKRKIKAEGDPRSFVTVRIAEPEHGLGDDFY